MAAKDDVDGSDVSKMVYSFGPRFFVEVSVLVAQNMCVMTWNECSSLLYLCHVARNVNYSFSFVVADGQASAGGCLLRAAGPARGRHHPPRRRAGKNNYARAAVWTQLHTTTCNIFHLHSLCMINQF